MERAGGARRSRRAPELPVPKAGSCPAGLSGLLRAAVSGEIK